MTVRGTISRDPRLSLDEWLEYVAHRADLVPPEPRTIANPFKSGTPVLWTPEPGDVSVLRDGSIVGGIAPSPEFDVDGELDVFYPDEHQVYVRHAATAVANDLRAVIVWDDPDQALDADAGPRCHAALRASGRHPHRRQRSGMIRAR